MKKLTKQLLFSGEDGDPILGDQQMQRANKQNAKDKWRMKKNEQISKYEETAELMKISYEAQLQLNEQLQREIKQLNATARTLKALNDNLITENKNLKLSIDSLITQTDSLKPGIKEYPEKKKAGSRFNNLEID